MYKLLRNTHLILGLLLFWVVMMYGVSAVQMAHRIRIETTVTESDMTLAPGLEPRTLANHLMETESIAGEMGNVSALPGGYRFPVTRAGGNTQVTYDRISGKVHLRETRTGMLGVLNRLHHFAGLDRETAGRQAWGWMVLVASLGLLILGATGLYMWFRLYKERVIGLILLTLNLVISLGLLAALRWT